MPSCDLCSADVGLGARRVRPINFREVARKGLRPRGAAASLGEALGIASDAGWLAMVESNNTDWVLCADCSREYDTFRDTEERTFHGLTVAEAEAKARAQIPADRLVSLDGAVEAAETTELGSGPDTSAATSTARERLELTAHFAGVPMDALLSEPVVRIVGEPESGEVVVSAPNEGAARLLATLPADAEVGRIEVRVPPKKGLGGLGKKPGTFVVHWSIPARAEITARFPARVKAVFKPDES